MPWVLQDRPLYSDGVGCMPSTPLSNHRCIYLTLLYMHTMYMHIYSMHTMYMGKQDRPIYSDGTIGPPCIHVHLNKQLIMSEAVPEAS